MGGSHPSRFTQSQLAEQREKSVWIQVLPIPTDRQLAHLLFPNVVIMNRRCNPFFAELNGFERHMRKTVHHVHTQVKFKQADRENASLFKQGKAVLTISVDSRHTSAGYIEILFHFCDLERRAFSHFI